MIVLKIFDSITSSTQRTLNKGLHMISFVGICPYASVDVGTYQ